MAGSVWFRCSAALGHRGAPGLALFFCSTLGQGLRTSTYPAEVIFSIALAIVGLILFALLIGNMQVILAPASTPHGPLVLSQSRSVLVSFSFAAIADVPAVADDPTGGDAGEEAGLGAVDAPPAAPPRAQETREALRPVQVAGDAGGGRGEPGAEPPKGPQEGHQAPSLPRPGQKGKPASVPLMMPLAEAGAFPDGGRRPPLFLGQQVPLFENMDERLLDAICERLKPSLYTEETFIVREGDPVDEMLFIIRGSLESMTTDGGRSGFFNQSLLKDGDFCGEELLTWALDPKSGSNLPSSTRTVRAVTEVEAFALIAEELKFVASQFRRLHSRQVQHTFRFHSQQWRTWAARFIQAAWRRYMKRKAAELQRKEGLEIAESVSTGSSSLGATIYASKFAANALRGVHRFRDMKTARELVKLQKPPEPDFMADVADH